MNYQYLDDAAAVADWQPASSADWLAVDTEFERQRTYYAELCLVQVSCGDTPALIDPRAGACAQPLSQLFNRACRGLIAHAFRQDLEVLQSYGCHFDTTLFDTQVAAALCGMHEQIGYADLAQELLGVTLDKSQTRTDWRKRPLAPAQLDYAADDVRYLHRLRDTLAARLDELGRLAWLEEECRTLLDEAWETPPNDAWRRVKGLGGVDEEAFARAVNLAAWRERRAQQRDLPRSWVLKDRDLVRLALDAPTSAGALARLLPGQEKFVRRQGEEILELLKRRPDGELPSRSRQLGPEDRQVARQLADEVRAIAEELGIAASLLLPRRDIDRLALGETCDRLQAGWRRTLLAPVIAGSPAGSAT